MAEEMDIPHPPALTKHSFNCPHCGAHSDQSWHQLFSKIIDNNLTPNLPGIEVIETIQKNSGLDKEERSKIIDFIKRINEKLVFAESSENGHYVSRSVHNLNLSRCFSCKKIAVWVHDSLLFPSKKFGISPNPDLPENIRLDYDEARKILDLSPRGAAALLRLAIQKLCIHLGQLGKNLNADIAALVQQGLDTRVQQALDIVRVVGNNAVHPGQMDVNDNNETARTLFSLVNLISEKMISEPKHLDTLYGSLPQPALDQIKKRDNSK